MIHTLIKTKLIWRILLLVLVITVSYLALTPRPPANVDLGWDKLNHLVAFCTLTFSGRLAFPQPRGERIVVYLGLLAFGGLIEFIQLFVPGRSGEWNDLLADIIGIAMGSIITTLVQGVGCHPNTTETSSSPFEHQRKSTETDSQYHVQDEGIKK